jgi:hypothetical protein
MEILTTLSFVTLIIDAPLMKNLIVNFRDLWKINNELKKKSLKSSNFKSNKKIDDPNKVI